MPPVVGPLSNRTTDDVSPGILPPVSLAAAGAPVRVLPPLPGAPAKFIVAGAKVAPDCVVDWPIDLRGGGGGVGGGDEHATL